MDDNSENLRKLIRLKLLAQYGDQPGAAYLKSQSLAEDDLGSRNDIMSSELWKRFAHGKKLPGEHQARYEKTFDDAPLDFAYQSKLGAADKEYTKNRDNELLVQQVAGQDNRQDFQKLMEALERFGKIKNPLKNE